MKKALKNISGPVILCVTLSTTGSLFGTAITVATTASTTATYNTYSQNAGPFPWTDLGITAGASVSGGVLNVATGGSTSYNMNSTITSGETLTPGLTTLQLGYTPGWTGSISSSPAANANLNSQFVYNIGPISGSTTLLNVPLSDSSVNKDLSSSLNAGTGLAVTSAQSVNGPSVTSGFTLAAQAFCPFCATVASVSFGFRVGTRIDQTVTATPTVINGDLVWYSKTATFSPADTFSFDTGAAGTVNDTFVNPSALGLVNGDTFFMNILPVVDLSMPVLNTADVAVPAALSANWDVFGATGSASYSLGDLYSLSNGGESFNFDPSFYAGFFYSIPIDFTDSCINSVCTNLLFKTPPGFTAPALSNAGIPSGSFPPITIGGGSATAGGYGNQTNLGTLFAGDPSSSDICGSPSTPYAGQCINQVTQTANAAAPEPSGLVLLGIGLLFIAKGLHQPSSKGKTDE